MNSKILLRRSYQKTFEILQTALKEMPMQGWLKTIREILGMTSIQMAEKLNISQPRIASMEKEEKNIKISTMERIAESLNCDFVYAFIPREKIDDIIYNQAKKKAEKILSRTKKNMALENQAAEDSALLEDIIQELLKGNIARIWD